jgi:threonine synthase
LGDAPQVHCIPVGNAGNITAYWKGYLEYKAAGRSSRLPRMLGFQAEGAAPIVKGHPIEHPETVATAIRIGNPASWRPAEAAALESGGSITAVSDEEILAAYRFLAAEESVYCEPASAASVAGLISTSGLGGIDKDETVVCVLTGNGLKDPDTALGQISPPAAIDADYASITKELGLG